MTAVVALPDDLVLLSIQLEKHNRVSYSDDDQNEGPKVETNSSEHVRSVTQSDHVDDADGYDGDADATVDLPFGKVEEEKWTVSEEENRAG